MLGLERGLNRVRHVLTPKRRVKNENTDSDEPNILSGKVYTFVQGHFANWRYDGEDMIANKFYSIFKGSF